MSWRRVRRQRCPEWRTASSAPQSTAGRRWTEQNHGVLQDQSADVGRDQTTCAEWRVVRWGDGGQSQW
eukprot:3104518-Rhodomonas_salina.2